MKGPSGTADLRRQSAFLGRLGVSLVLVGLLVWLVDWGRLGARLATVDVAFLAVVVLLATADRLLMAWKWWLLLRGRSVAVSLWAAVRAYYVASFVGYFLPMTIGGDAVRIGALGGGGRTAALVASVVLERLVGALAQGVLALVSLGTLLALGLGARIGPAERWMLVGVVAAALAAFPLSFPAARRLAGGLAGDGWRGALRSLAQSYAAYASAGALLVVFFGLTLLEGAFPVAIHYGAARALGLDPGWTLFIATVPLVFLVARLPISFGGLGVLELSFVSVAGLLGLAPTEAFAIAGLATVLYLVALTPGAVLYLLPAAAPLRVGPRLP